ncbi:MAG: GGDEF domain-containing protein [Desulfarculus sp.]|nr:GGDEF domain-containing protein [Desulfarculus sp.]
MDIRTLLVAITVLELAILVAMFFFWRTQKTYPGFGHWVICNLLVVAGCLLLGLKDHIPVFISEVVGNTAFILGALLRLQGLRLFLGLPPGHRLEWLYVAATAAGLAWFSLVQDSWTLRTLVISLPIGVLALQGAWLLLRQKDSPAATLCRAMAVAILAYFLALTARAFFLLPAGPAANLFMEHPLQYAYFLLGIIVEVFWNISFAMMNSSRLASELRQAQDDLTRLATTDHLTGARNRRSLLERGAAEMARARRHGHPLAALLLDLDHLKQINDTQGHQAGDRALRALVATCQDGLRQSDILGRLGGDEFVLLLPETDLEGARSMAKRLCQKVAHLSPAEVGITQGLSLSVGISLLEPVDQTLDELLHRADQALYQAKESGRDQVSEARCPGGQ